MPRPSSIDRLDPSIQEKIGELRNAGRTIDEILAKLRELDVDVSRSALGRHVKSLDEIAENLRRTRALAEGMVGKLGDQADSKLTRLNVELLQNVLVNLSIDPESGQVATLSAQEAFFASNALKSLAGAAKTDVELRAAIRKQIQAEMMEALDAEAKANRGLTSEAVASLKARFLGMKAA